MRVIGALLLVTTNAAGTGYNNTVIGTGAGSSMTTGASLHF